MSVSYRGSGLPLARTSWGAPALASKTWGFFGVDGEHYLHGGTRGRRFSVSGTAPETDNAVFEGWIDGVTGTAIIDGRTYTNVIVLDVTYGRRFTDAGTGTLYNEYTIFFLQLLT